MVFELPCASVGRFNFDHFMDRASNTKHPLRNRALLTAVYFSLATCDFLANMTVIDFEIAVSDCTHEQMDTLEPLRLYIEQERHAPYCSFMFPGNDRGHLSAASIGRQIKRITGMTATELRRFGIAKCIQEEGMQVAMGLTKMNRYRLKAFEYDYGH